MPCCFSFIFSSLFFSSSSLPRVCCFVLSPSILMSAAISDASQIELQLICCYSAIVSIYCFLLCSFRNRVWKWSYFIGRLLVATIDKSVTDKFCEGIRRRSTTHFSEEWAIYRWRWSINDFFLLLFHRKLLCFFHFYFVAIFDSSFLREREKCSKQ